MKPFALRVGLAGCDHTAIRVVFSGPFYSDRSAGNVRTEFRSGFLLAETTFFTGPRCYYPRLQVSLTLTVMQQASLVLFAISGIGR